MNSARLLALCAQGNPHIYLTFPAKRPPKGMRARLLGQKGPLGRLCNVKEKGDEYLVTAVFSAVDIYALALELKIAEQEIADAVRDHNSAIDAATVK
jgi:hypothetical protein